MKLIQWSCNDEKLYSGFTGDLPSRLCTAAEIKVYLDSLSGSSYIGQNRNCNITSWISGCEPGWACSTGPDEDLRVEDEEIPARTLNCQACCKGFFCPQGLTCMIRKCLKQLSMLSLGLALNFMAYASLSGYCVLIHFFLFDSLSTRQ